jgi:hypothetical protein
MAKRSNITAGSAAPPKSGERKDNPEDSRPWAKISDPAYIKFTTCIRRRTHLGVKTRLVSKERS